MEAKAWLSQPAKPFKGEEWQEPCEQVSGGAVARLSSTLLFTLPSLSSAVKPRRPSDAFHTFKGKYWLHRAAAATESPVDLLDPHRDHVKRGILIRLLSKQIFKAYSTYVEIESYKAPRPASRL